MAHPIVTDASSSSGRTARSRHLADLQRQAELLAQAGMVNEVEALRRQWDTGEPELPIDAHDSRSLPRLAGDILVLKYLSIDTGVADHAP